MANGCCTNSSCIDRETQLRLARLREELLTNFNSLLLDRIRFLEDTIHRLSLPHSQLPTSLSALPSQVPQTPTSTAVATSPTSAHICTNPISIPSSKDRLSTPSPLRRSSSTTTYFLLSPNSQSSNENGAGARSCPSSVDLSSSSDRRRRFFSSKKFSQSRARQSSESNSNYLSIPIDAQWSSFAADVISNSSVGNERGRLESRRFACDVDDNEVRAFKAMIYMEQARKQHARPLTRLRQALGISSNSTAGSFTFNNSKKHSNA